MIQTPLKEVAIDYPQPGELVAPGPYSFRINAPADAKEVRLSIDDGPWQTCRSQGDRWWFDWPDAAPGEHVAIGRVIEGDGSLLVTPPRAFKVQSRS